MIPRQSYEHSVYSPWAPYGHYLCAWLVHQKRWTNAEIFVSCFRARAYLEALIPPEDSGIHFWVTDMFFHAMGWQMFLELEDVMEDKSNYCELTKKVMAEVLGACEDAKEIYPGTSETSLEICFCGPSTMQ